MTLFVGFEEAGFRRFLILKTEHCGLLRAPWAELPHLGSCLPDSRREKGTQGRGQWVWVAVGKAS